MLQCILVVSIILKFEILSIEQKKKDLNFLIIDFRTTDDEELYDKQNPFSIETDIIPMAVFFNRFCFALLSHSPPGGNPPTTFELARRILLQLHSRDTRRPFSGENIWLLIKDPKKSLPKSLKDIFKKSSSNNNDNKDKDQMGKSFLERIRDEDPISIKILNLSP